MLAKIDVLIVIICIIRDISIKTPNYFGYHKNNIKEAVI